jgi:hypothetical protein
MPPWPHFAIGGRPLHHLKLKGGEGMAKKPTIVIGRNSVNGRFVTPQYVQQHPRTTETEHWPAPQPKKGK